MAMKNLSRIKFYSEQLSVFHSNKLSIDDNDQGENDEEEPNEDLVLFKDYSQE
jgi:hypothetical protein